MQRFTITLDEELIDQLEVFMSKRGYENRSEAIRDMIRQQLQDEHMHAMPAGECVANLSYVFNHHERELASRLTHAHHDHHDLSVSTMHIHLDHDNCMETVVLHGKANEVEAFANSILSQPGVRHGNLYMLPVKSVSSKHTHGHTTKSHEHIKPVL